MSDFSLGILGLSIRSYLFMYTRVNRVYKRDLDHVLEERGSQNQIARPTIHIPYHLIIRIHHPSSSIHTSQEQHSLQVVCSKGRWARGGLRTYLQEIVSRGGFSHYQLSVPLAFLNGWPTSYAEPTTPRQGRPEDTGCGCDAGHSFLHSLCTWRCIKGCETARRVFSRAELINQYYPPRQTTSEAPFYP